MNYKNSIYKAFAAATLLSAAACSEDYLDLRPEGLIDAEDVAATMQADPSKVQSYVTGAYMNFYNGGDYATSHDIFGMPDLFIATFMMTDDVTLPRNAQWFSFDYQLDNRLADYRRTAATWREIYQVVNDCNTVIELLKPAEGEEPSKENAQMLGQMYTLRSYCYYLLVNLYAKPYSSGKDQLAVPIKTDEVYEEKRATIEEVYAQIESDVLAGYDYLKGKGYYGGKGAMSEYAAAFVYANALLQMGQYEKAAEYAEIAMSGNNLNSPEEMMSGFNSLDMSEVIWGMGVTSETTCYYAGFFSHVDTYMIGYGGQVGYRKLGASELVDKIDANDVRKGWFGYQEDYDLLGVDYSYEQGNGWLPYLSNKFRDVYLTSMGEIGPFESDIIYFRAAEMYFVAAEAYYLANKPEKAVEVLNKIISTRIPGYACTKSGEELYKEICLQKRIEMFEENTSRFFDIRRRNEKINRALSTDLPLAGLQYLNAVEYEGYDYRLVYQIPTVETQNNPEITENNP
ncbi:MAG: RagB/SusD family nutrient uptake outer membrane protein [Bacteroides sp.]|nr:RagB/SusD family nutrient uptake outer membrane protein [Bacteroides sp.]